MANSEKLDLVMSIPFLIQGEASEGTVRLQVYVLRLLQPQQFCTGFLVFTLALATRLVIYPHDILHAI